MSTVDCMSNPTATTSTDEGVLRDVLSELERERIRRAELEAEIFQLRQQQQIKDKGKETPDSPEKIEDDRVSNKDSPLKSQSVLQGLDSNDEDHLDLDCMDKIHSMIDRYKSKATGLSQSQVNLKNLEPIITKFFQDYYDKTILTNNKRIRTNSMKKKQRIEKETRVKEAVTQVMNYYREYVSNRVSLQENTEKVLIPILKVTLSDFLRTIKANATVQNEQANRDRDNNRLIRGLSPDEENTERKMHLDLLALRTERDGLLNLVDALTTDNNAITLAMNNSPGTLPIHVVRCLEIMPWEAQEHTLVTDEVHEWQAYDRRTKTWTSKLKAFPPYFAALPFNKLENVDDNYESTLSSSSSSSLFEKRSNSKNNSPAKGGGGGGGGGGGNVGNNNIGDQLQRVFDNFSLNGESLLLTDKSCTHILDLRDGYPLPSQGTWEWINGWTLVTSEEEGSSHVLNTDANGWSYAELPEYLVSELKSQCLDKPQSHDDKKKTQQYQQYRRRTRMRQRALVSYPGISQRTKEMLTDQIKIARLTLAISKLNEQVFSMQRDLVHKEEEMEQQTHEMLSMVSIAEQEAEERQGRIDQLEHSLKENILMKSAVKSEKSLVMKLGISPVKSSPPSKPRPALTFLGGSLVNKDNAKMKTDNVANEEKYEKGVVEDHDVLTTQVHDSSDTHSNANAASNKGLKWTNVGNNFLVDSMRNNVHSISEKARTNVQTISEKARTSLQHKK